MRVLFWLLLAVLGMALGGGNFFYPYLSARDHLLVWVLCFSLPIEVLVWWLARRGESGTPRMRVVLAACLLLPLLTEWAAESWWPNSGDEYGYTFLARTLLHGRLFNPPPPFPFLYDFAWIFTRDGKRFSQYPPGWPALLAPFLQVGIAWILNPLLDAALGWLSWRTLLALRVPRRAATAGVCLLMFSPFVMFNAASMFPHTLTGVLIVAIILLQTKDEISPSAGKRLGIGALFGALLITRYEVFTLTAAAYVLDRLCYRRAAFARDAVPMAIGGLPAVAAFVAYNLAITGHPFKTPYAWVSRGAHIGLWGKHIVFWEAFWDAVLRTLHWFGELSLFTSPLLIGLVLLGAVAKLRAGKIRFYDLMFPVAIIFFFLYPNDGGHEFGPRYWYFAWPGAMLSVMTGLADGDWLRIGRWRLQALALADWHMPVFLGVSLSVALFTHIYVDARREVYMLAPPRTPALVLIPSRNLMLTPLQTEPILAQSTDFPRNTVDLDGPVLYGRSDRVFAWQKLFKSFACRVKDRHIYIWRAPGRLDDFSCAD